VDDIMWGGQSRRKGKSNRICLIPRSGESLSERSGVRQCFEGLWRQFGGDVKVAPFLDHEWTKKGTKETDKNKNGGITTKKLHFTRGGQKLSAQREGPLESC